VSCSASRCSAGTFDLEDSCVFFRSLYGQRSARLTRRGGSSPSGVRPRVTFVRGQFLTRQNRLPDRKVPIRPAGFIAMPVPSARDKRCFRRQSVQTGRRLMRQTVLPTPIQSRTATMRGESPARHLALRGSRSARRTALRFGLPFTPESGGPSRYQAAQYARAVIRACRRQESPNAQQNVDRRHSPGRDPGGRGPRQSRRRV
jgi:hypothetical protein